MSCNSDLRTVAIDVTHTIASGQHSGVQRVVRNVAEQLSGEVGAALQVVMHDGHEFRAVDLQQIDSTFRRLNRIRSNVAAHLPHSFRTSAEKACRLPAMRRLRDWLVPPPGHQGIYRTPLKIWQRSALSRQFGERAVLGKTDILILPDAYWSYNKIWPSVREFRRRGTFVATLLYDLIPISHPEFVVPGASETFRQYLYQAATNSDLLLTISATVKRQVEATLPELWPDEKLCKNIQAFELGAELGRSNGAVGEEVLQLFSPQRKRRPYLMIATLEPRKNHKLVLDAFDEVWQQHPDVPICFIGNVGWLCDRLLERIRTHPRYGKQLHLLHGVTDAELSHCYRYANALIFPSITEGCGLPIIEAKWHGCRVLASDTEIHREVARDDCLFFDLECPSQLANLIKQAEGNDYSLRSSKARKCLPPSWSASSRQLLRTCVQHREAKRDIQSSRAVDLGSARPHLAEILKGAS